MMKQSSTEKGTVQIAGAGPAGLAAAITLARAGRAVVVREAQPEVGYRFRRDLQGLENWTTDTDVLQVLEELGITTDFDRRGYRRGLCFDAKGRAYPIQSREPLFYLVERGPRPGSLDSAMLKQALALGVTVRFNDRVNTLEGEGILAIGPKAADAIAVGYHFDTDMDDGYWVICDDRLAPKGYAYLLVMGGRGTVKSCMFTGFKQEKECVERTVEAFRRRVGLRMFNARPHGGVGNFRIPRSALAGRHPVIGEQAGFQDTLWGFGMRIAIQSGVLAARSLLGRGDYNRLWRRELEPGLRTAVVNRAMYGLLGNTGYSLLLRRQSRNDAREFLTRQYRPTRLKQFLYPWARRRYHSRRHDESCDHMDCSCVVCRCEHSGQGA